MTLDQFADDIQTSKVRTLRILASDALRNGKTDFKFEDSPYYLSQEGLPIQSMKLRFGIQFRGIVWWVYESVPHAFD